MTLSLPHRLARRPTVWSDARASAMVFLEDEKVRLYILLDAIDSAGLVNSQATRDLILDRLHELEKE